MDHSAKIVRGPSTENKMRASKRFWVEELAIIPRTDRLRPVTFDIVSSYIYCTGLNLDSMTSYRIFQNDGEEATYDYDIDNNVSVNSLP